MQGIIDYFCPDRIGLYVVNAADKIFIFLDNHALEAILPKMTDFAVFCIKPYGI